MKKKYLIVAGITFLISTGTASAQSVSQLVTQLELDLQKLAELKAILQDMYTNYTIIEKGYSDIKDIAHGNFSLHKIYLDGLLAISQPVRDDARISDIINTESAIAAESQASYRQFHADGHFSAAELDYIGNTHAAILKRSEVAIDELLMVITANQLRMSDADRLQAIERIYTGITSQLSLLRQFDNATRINAIQRLKTANDIKTLKNIYGIQ